MAEALAPGRLVYIVNGCRFLLVVAIQEKNFAYDSFLLLGRDTNTMSESGPQKERKQGRIHGYPSRVRVGRSNI